MAEAIAIAVTLGVVLVVALIAFGLAELRRRLSRPIVRRRGYDWSKRG